MLHSEDETYTGIVDANTGKLIVLDAATGKDVMTGNAAQFRISLDDLKSQTRELTLTLNNGAPYLSDVPGQVISREILAFIEALDTREIHGYRPELGFRVFTEEALADKQAPTPSAGPRSPISDPPPQGLPRRRAACGVDVEGRRERGAEGAVGAASARARAAAAC